MPQNLFKRFGRYARFQRIGWQVRQGILPAGVDQGEIYEALRHTKKPNVLEMFGFLRVRTFRKRGYLWTLMDDLGLVSCKKVTTAFANYLVDSLQDTENYLMDAFTYHDIGDDNTAESNAHTALQNSRETRVSGSQAENGANVYKSVANITATAGYTAEEHGLFSAESAGTMLDRNLIPNAPALITDDVIECTYELTVNAEA